MWKVWGLIHMFIIPEMQIHIVNFMINTWLNLLFTQTRSAKHNTLVRVCVHPFARGSQPYNSIVECVALISTFGGLFQLLTWGGGY